MTKKIILINLFIFLLLIGLIEGVNRMLVSKEKQNLLFNNEDLRIRGRSFIQRLFYLDFVSDEELLKLLEIL